MANPLAELFVKIGADVKGLKTGLTSAESQVGKFAGTIKKHHRAIGMAMTAMGGAILAAGVLSVKTYAQMGDEVAKMARKTGFSTETLSELKHVAEISGTSIQGLDKATKRMAKTIVDASEGMTTYIRAFDRIGLSIEELQELSPEEQFIKIGEAIAAIEDPTIRAATAQDIFGRAGMDLIPMFDEGSEKMAELRQEAHRLGIVFDQEAAEKAEKLTDNMHRVNEATSGLKIVIAEVLAPVITELAEKLSNVIVQVRAWMEAHPELTKLIITMTMAVGGLLLVLGPLLIMLPGLTMAVTAFGAAIHFALGPVGLLTLGIAMMAFGAYQLYLQWDRQVAAIKNLWTSLENAARGAFGAIGSAIESMIQPIVRSIEWLDRLWAALMRIMGLGGRPTPAGGRARKTAVAALAGAFLPEWGTAEPEESMQRGGIIRRPTIARLGEAGPEAVIPLNKFGGMGGINITLSGIFMGNESEARKLAGLIRKYLRQEERHLYGGAVV